LLIRCGKKQAAEIVRRAFHGHHLNFRVITLQEPPKQQMVAFLEKEHLRETQTPRPPRVARVQVTVPSASGSYELVELLVDLDSAKLIKQEHLVGKHPYIDSAYMQAVEKACRENARVQAEIQKLKLPAGASVVIEPWAYATDGMKDMSERTTMVCASPRNS
jgi:primary-amine oxidase